jgi:ribosomal protein L13
MSSSSMQKRLSFDRQEINPENLFPSFRLSRWIFIHTGRPYARKTSGTRQLKWPLKGMLPKNKLGAQMFRKLNVYAGAEHPHQAQQPEVLELNIR